jgi:hypothetical protein
MDQKTSLLVNKQLPEFIKEEYPKFISFLEAYYEFLETKIGEKNNDLTNEAKKLRYVSDVDFSLTQFEDNFYNIFLSSLPKDVEVSKDFLIKNILPFYKSKGSEKSFQFLFKLLFGEEVNIKYPKDVIIKTSDGKWFVQNILRVTDNAYTIYRGDGITKEFNIAPCRCPITFQVIPPNVDVEVDGQLLTSGYFIRKESLKISFDVPPNDGSIIKINYRNFDTRRLINRQIKGLTSNATAIVENITQRSVSLNEYFEFSIDQKTLNGRFNTAEEIQAFIFINDELININLSTESSLKIIDIVDGGSSYNIGDSVIIRGLSRRNGSAVIDDVITGFISAVQIIDGGCGYQVGNKVEISNVSSLIFDASVDLINLNTPNSSNNILIYPDTLSNLENVIVNDEIDANVIISQQISNNSLTVGAIGSIFINLSRILATEPNISFITTSSKVNEEEEFDIRVLDLGIIGQIQINDGGEGYEVGDELIFTNLPDVFNGHDATAIVSKVDANGKIQNINITNGGIGYDPSRWPTINVISVTGNVTSLNVTNTGFGFVETPEVLILGSNTSPAIIAANGTVISVQIGNPGTGYEIGNTFIATGGTGNSAVLTVDSVDVNGNVTSITITNPGQYISLPILQNNPFTSNTGSGTGFTANLSIGIGDVIIVDAGDGYKPETTSASIIGPSGSNGSIDVTVTVQEKNRANANLTVKNLMGQGEILSPFTEQGVVGKILSIKILDPGSQYTQAPVIDLTTSGDGTAIATAEIQESFSVLPGVWKTSDGLLSTEEIRIQGRDYFINFSYVLQSKVEFNKYKSFFKKFIHPAGMINYSEYLIPNKFIETSSTINAKIMKMSSGTVNINSSIYLIGTNTSFETLNTKNILVSGTVISVNNEIRIVDEIMSNTELTVTESFNTNSNNQLLLILT